MNFLFCLDTTHTKQFFYGICYLKQMIDIFNVSKNILTSCLVLGAIMVVIVC